MVTLLKIKRKIYSGTEKFENNVNNFGEHPNYLFLRGNAYMSVTFDVSKK
jgi:hypothetical protein